MPATWVRLPAPAPALAVVRFADPAALPVSLAEFKLHARIDHDDEDDALAVLLAAAVEHVDGQGVSGRALITQDWAVWTGPAPGLVPLPVGPVQSLVSVHYHDADGVLQAADVADFEAVGVPGRRFARPKSGASWPAAASRPDAIRTVWRAGYGATAAAVPDGLRVAILMLAAHWYRHREAVAEGQPVPVPLAFEALIGAERIGWYG